MKDSLIYPVADTLQLAMHLMPDGKVRGAGTRSLACGGIKFEAEMVVASDFHQESSAGYLARIHANLWAYMVILNADANPPDLQMWLFDALALDLRARDIATFGCGEAKATITKLLPALRARFEFTAKSKKWVKADVADMEFLV